MLINYLPEIRGRYRFNYPLSKATWFQVGGEVDVLFQPIDVKDLCFFLKNRSKDLPLFTLGAGSNLLVRDGGISGIAIKLGSGFNDFSWDGNLLIAGAACLDRTIALSMVEKGLSGLEFLVGIPGTIGGAIRMNAGAYGREVKDVLEWVEAVDEEGNIHYFKASEMTMSYRKCLLSDTLIFTRAAFRVEISSPSDVQSQIERILSLKEATQPIKGRTGGSTFKNPSPDLSAWQLIDQAGCRGLSKGNVIVSEKHCNFLLNLGKATAKEIEELGEEIRQRVYNCFGIQLEWEIIRIGKV
ncbi:MAG: UDP-N-acetylmuramate dehydrogenase [Proteobacteria bacterium]|nr:UDP-N-acetylmuramate dehydrogenase [Pseudomonadota bacterium]